MSTVQASHFFKTLQKIANPLFLRTIRLSGLICIALLFLALSGCGGSAADPGGPLIRNFQYLGQLPNKPYSFVFSIEWQDNEGDVAPGQLVFELENLDTGKKEKPILIPLPASSVSGSSGTFQKDIEIAVPADETYPQRLKVTAYMQDSKENKSNRPWVILEKNL